MRKLKRPPSGMGGGGGGHLQSGKVIAFIVSQLFRDNQQEADLPHPKPPHPIRIRVKIKAI